MSKLQKTLPNEFGNYSKSYNPQFSVTISGSALQGGRDADSQTENIQPAMGARMMSKMKRTKQMSALSKKMMTEKPIDKMK